MSGDGLEVLTGAYNVDADNLAIKALTHAVHVEDQGTPVHDVTISNSTAVNGIHGFVSKSGHVDFIHDKAINMSLDGFVLVSDNILGFGY